MCKAVKLTRKEDIISIAQEIAFARALAANDKSLRDRALKKLKKWLITKSRQESSGPRYSEEGFMRLCKGLYYCVWMSDKPLYQEEVAESISHLVHCFSNPEDAQTFIRCFFQSLSKTWFGLDVHRIDKYLMLVRRFLRQTLEYLHNHEWKKDVVELYCKHFYKSLLGAPLGLNLHLAEIFLEELAKVGRGKVSPRIVAEIVKPFAEVLATSSDARLLKYITDYIFLQLLRQSEEGLKHQTKFEAWKQMGFPEGDIDVMEEVEDEEKDEEDTPGSEEENMETEGGPLDPRAGRIDVCLPTIEFDGTQIRNAFNELSKKKETTTKARKVFKNLIKKYDTYLHGKYPLGIHRVELPEVDDMEEVIEEAAEELLTEEMVDYSDAKRARKWGKSQNNTNIWEVTEMDEEDLNSSVNNESLSSIGNKWEIEELRKKRPRKSVKNKKKGFNGRPKRMKITVGQS